MSLCAQQVSLTLSGARLLDGIDVEIQPGTITTVLGPNGAGKTSLLRVLTDELAPDAGAVLLNGRALSEWSTLQRARTLAVLPQHSLLSFPFTVEEVVMMGRTPHDTGLARDREIVAQALQVVDGDYLARRFYTRLSGGEKQRVQLARVLAQVWEAAPEGQRFLLLDEPTSSFDLAHQHLTLEVVRNLATKGVGILMVVHDLNLAARCADQMVLMQCGSIVHSGAPETVLTEEHVRQVFQVEARIDTHPVSGRPLVIT